MKLLIIDGDCRDLFLDLSLLPKRIHLDDCQVLTIEEANADKMKEIQQDGKWEKCIFLLSFLVG